MSAMVAEGVEQRKPGPQLHLEAVGRMLPMGLRSIIEIPVKVVAFLLPAAVRFTRTASRKAETVSR